MDFEHTEEVSESEVDALGIKKKDDALIDVDADDTVSDVDLVDEDKEKEDTDHGYFGDDKDYEKLILDPYDDNPEYN